MQVSFGNKKCIEENRSRQAGKVYRRARETGHRPLPPILGSRKLTELRPEHFRQLYAQLRKEISPTTKKTLSKATIEGVHACLCGILSDAMEGGFLDHNPA